MVNGVASGPRGVGSRTGRVNVSCSWAQIFTLSSQNNWNIRSCFFRAIVGNLDPSFPSCLKSRSRDVIIEEKFSNKD